MEDGGVWRHENKYVCSAATLQILEARIRPLMQPDSHTGPDGSYHIRSVYFDDEWDTCYRENEAGTDPREKFRIRIYNGCADRITLELKQKMRGLTRKLSCPLTRKQCESALRGDLLLKEEGQPELLRKFVLQQKQRRFLPKVIVDYDRRPWVYRLGNVRITFDENIASSGRVSEFLEKPSARRPVMPAGYHVLEVKYDAFLPDYIRQVLQLDALRRTPFSKYYLCRTFR